MAPLQEGRNAFEIFKHQFICRMTDTGRGVFTLYHSMAGGENPVPGKGFLPAGGKPRILEGGAGIYVQNDRYEIV